MGLKLPQVQLQEDPQANLAASSQFSSGCITAPISPSRSTTRCIRIRL
jgi:hypothetical protein